MADREYQKCATCDGTGYLPPESSDPWGPCPTCDGEGKLPLPTPTELMQQAAERNETARLL